MAFAHHYLHLPRLQPRRHQLRHHLRRHRLRGQHHADDHELVLEDVVRINLWICLHYDGGGVWLTSILWTLVSPWTPVSLWKILESVNHF